jgi:uncharacterized protein YndB with AHSA1/START domain
MNTSIRKRHGRTIETSTRIKTSPRRAWEAWADPAQIANWFVDRAEGKAEPGEVMTWIFDAFNYRQPVPIQEATPGELFVIGSGDAPGPHGHPYMLEITIASEHGETVMRLVNSGFREDAASDDDFEGVSSGWTMALATLRHWLERYPLLRRSHHIVFEPATYTPDALRPLFGTVDGRRRWLEPLVPADAPVLADTGREVLLAWDTRDAVLGLKAFKMGPQSMLALDLSAWGVEADAPAADAELKQALARLRLALAATPEAP